MKMRGFLLLVAIAGFATASPDTDIDELIERINARNTTWKAGRNHGSFYTMKETFQPNIALPVAPRRSMLSPIPSEFDARNKWPECKSLWDIRDQGPCGSCWAVASAAAMSDRICIQSNATKNVYVSEAEIIHCCHNCSVNDNGCDGGYTYSAFQYWASNGVVSGGKYGSEKSCQPYTIPDGNSDFSKILNRLSAKLNVPRKCENKCENGETYNKDRSFGSTVYWYDSVSTIQQAIMEKGPVAAGMTVYEDLKYYKTGVYQSDERIEQAGHTVKIIGWGKENGIPYWLISNSWGEGWGEKGFAKFLRGQNHCGIEKSVIGGDYRSDMYV